MVWTPILAYLQVTSWEALMPGHELDDTDDPPNLKAV